MTIGERIKEVRKANRLTLEKFGERICVKAQSVSAIEKGINKPADRTINLICREFEIREEWLRTGDGPMKVEKPSDETLAAELAKVITAGNEDFRKRLIAWLVRMPPERWKALEEIALDLLRDAGNLTDIAAPAARSREEEADEVAEKVRKQILNGGEKASESGTPPEGGVGIA